MLRREDVDHVLRLVRMLAIPVKDDLGYEPMLEAVAYSYKELRKLDVRDDRGNPISSRQRLIVAGLKVGLDMAKEAEKLIRKRSPNGQEQAAFKDSDFMPWDELCLEHLAAIALVKVTNPKHRALVFLEWGLCEDVGCLHSFFAGNRQAFNKMKVDARKSCGKAFETLRNIAGHSEAHVPDGNPPRPGPAVNNPNSTGADVPDGGLPRVLYSALCSPGTPFRYIEMLGAVRWLRAM